MNKQKIEQLVKQLGIIIPTTEQLAEREIAERKREYAAGKPKKNARAEMLDIELSAKLKFANSYQRVGILLDYHPKLRSSPGGRRRWFRHLGEEWG